MVLRHSGLYVIAALKSIAMLNKADKITMDALEEYEKNCTLAGAAEDAILGFKGKKGRGDLKNGSFTIIVNFAIRGDYSNLPTNYRELEKRINLTGAIQEAENYVRDKVDKAVNALEPIKDCYEKKALICLARQIAENIK
jgi:geranylgeranyl pyrophosphate synthase